jgi:hypothetical protein
MQERQREMLRLFAELGVTSFEKVSLVEVGCGTGMNLLEFLRLGFRPHNLIEIELLEERVAVAQSVLPGGILRAGDLTTMDLG